MVIFTNPYTGATITAKPEHLVNLMASSDHAKDVLRIFEKNFKGFAEGNVAKHAADSIEFAMEQIETKQPDA